jgi:putative SOS response-associated peptidase YedK
MCYFLDNSKIKVNGKKRDLEIKNSLSSYTVGLQYPMVPIITNDSLTELVLARWRFRSNIPETSHFRTVGLNIRAETADKVDMFKDCTENHCIVPVNGFYEWKHFNNSKIKVKHFITMPEQETFFLAGLWRFYDNKKISFGILTTASNDLMTDIHNNQKRMPICFNQKQADRFLQSNTIEEFIFPNLNPHLEAKNIEPEKIGPNLF